MLFRAIFIINICLVFVGSGMVSLSSAASRADLVNKELDCVSQSMKNSDDLGWGDVCYTDYDTEGEDGIDKQEAVDNAIEEQSEKRQNLNTDIILEGFRTKDGVVMDNAVRIKATDDVDFQRSYAEHEQALRDYVEKDRSNDAEKNWFWDFFNRENPLNTLDAGFDVYRFQYREPSIMKENGPFAGMFVHYTHRLSDNSHIKDWKDAFKFWEKINLFRIELRGAYGLIDYTGSGKLENTPNYTMESRGIVGYDIPFDNKRVTPFMGLGYRYLLDASGGEITTTNRWAYDREIRYMYIPMGIETELKKSSWSFGVTFEYDLFLGGKVRSHLEDGGYTVQSADSGLWYILDPLNNNQKHGDGYRCTINISKETERFKFYFEPFVRYWTVKDSDKTQWSSQDGSIFWYIKNGGTRIPVYGYEPENDTTEYGVRLGVNF